MKKTTTLIAFLFMLLGTKAQSNLQLSQVLTYNGSLQPNQLSTKWIVPSGKVWKIEARSPDFFVINGTYFTGGAIGLTSNYGRLSGAPISLPIWLKSGDNIWYQTNNDYPFPTDYFISILEFNLTQ
jgi:hypothetical protein